MSAFKDSGALKTKGEAVPAEDWNIATKKCGGACKFKDHRRSCRSDFQCNDAFPVSTKEKKGIIGRGFTSMMLSQTLAPGALLR